jgi:hypothetical protein
MDLLVTFPEPHPPECDPSNSELTQCLPQGCQPRLSLPVEGNGKVILTLQTLAD